MAKAAAELNIHFNTLKRLALLYGCYHPNQGLKGGNKHAPSKFALDKILAGDHPHFQTFKLKNRLLKSREDIEKISKNVVQNSVNYESLQAIMITQKQNEEDYRK